MDERVLLALEHCDAAALRTALDAASPSALDGADDDGATPLCLAAAGGDAACVAELLSRGAAREAASRSESYTPLCFAARYGRCRALALLCAAGCELEARDAYGNTPLLLAAGFGHLDALRLLQQAGADGGAVNGDGDGALAYASRWEWAVEVVRYFLETGGGGEVAATNRRGESVADVACPEALALLRRADGVKPA